MIVFPPAVRLRRAAVVGALCAGLAVAATGCGEDPDKGTNGVGKLAADAIEAKARSAATEADAVRLSGTVVSGGKSFTLDMRLKADGGAGRVKASGSTFELLRVGEELYLKADAEFWGRKPADATGSPAPTPSGTADGADGEAAADKLGDKYVKVPAGDPSYKQLRGFTEMDVLLDGLLGLNGKLEKGAYRKVGSVRTIEITADKGAGGRLDVSLIGTPFPLRLERAGGAGIMELADWDKPFTLTAPPKDETLDYGSQLPSRG
ncbi:hypothetical protein LG634_19160 [Streptomyces bambusae]|uniref:hypothetical protein n=1 Tax=Streptomyces bambusae TaxID=1550616 RepID=UPI001CFE6ED8|nr:hypothetical protein [Streptomyces bambusae]MCB5166952.1 hypothetical protein [Streptomyces bambusae]